MAGFTRKTHVVRVKSPFGGAGASGAGAWVDIEVLDALAFKTTNGKVHIWKCPSSEAVPYIADESGDTPDWSTGGANSTRGSHVEAYGGGDIEVLDRIAFIDGQDGNRPWILDMPSADAAPFCVTDGTGDPNSTRRTHLEVVNETTDTGGTGGVGGSFSGPNSPGGGGSGSRQAFIVERVDMIGFTGADEKKLIVKMESHDDGNGARASTAMTPSTYDPNVKANSVPPDAADPNKYFKFIQTYSPPQPIYSNFGWAVIFNYTTEAQARLGLGPTFETGPVSTTAAGASAFGAAVIAGGLTGGVFNFSGFSVTFIPKTIIGTLPGGFSPNNIGVPASDLTKKCHMGPLWWVRAFSNGH